MHDFVEIAIINNQQTDNPDIFDIWNSYSQQAQKKLTDEYRDIMTGLLDMAERFDGSETLHTYLRAWEIWLQMKFRSQIGNELSLIEQKTIGHLLDATETYTSTEIWLKAKKSLYNRLASIATNEYVLPSVTGARVHYQGTILPPDSEGQPVFETTEAPGRESHEITTRPKVAELLLLLIEQGVYMNEIVIVQGTLEKNIMRKIPYILIEILRLRKQVLICDQVGEKTFVIHGIFNRERILSMKKKQLSALLTTHITPVIYANSKQWQQALMQQLFTKKNQDYDENIEPISTVAQPRISIPKREEFIATVKTSYATSEVWHSIFCATTADTAKDQILPGIGISKAASILGLDVPDGDARRKKTCIQIGLSIYGDDDPILYQALTDMHFTEALEKKNPLALAKLREEIKEKYPTLKVWRTKRKEMQSGKITKLFALHAIGLFFDVPNARNQTNEHLYLGLKIYDNTDPDYENTKKELDQLTMPDHERKKTIISHIKSVFPHSSAYLLAFKSPITPKINILGMNLSDIGHFFGIVGNPNKNRKSFVLLGLEIYGNNDTTLQEALTGILLAEMLKKHSPEAIAQLNLAIQRKYPTSSDWLSLWQNDTEPTGTLVYNFGITFIAHNLGIEGRIAKNKTKYCELGLKIYGVNDAVLLTEISRLQRRTA